jgi:hypothetical protein
MGPQHFLPYTASSLLADSALTQKDTGISHVAFPEGTSSKPWWYISMWSQMHRSRVQELWRRSGLHLDFPGCCSLDTQAEICFRGGVKWRCGVRVTLESLGQVNAGKSVGVGKPLFYSFAGLSLPSSSHRLESCACSSPRLVLHAGGPIILGSWGLPTLYILFYMFYVICNRLYHFTFHNSL